MLIGFYYVFFVLLVIGRVVQSLTHYPVESLLDIQSAVKNSKTISLKDSITEAVKKMSPEEIRQIIEDEALGAPGGKTQAQLLEEAYTQIASQANEVANLQARLQAILKSQTQAEAQEQSQSQTESEAQSQTQSQTQTQTQAETQSRTQSQRQALTQHEALAQLELANAQALSQEIALTKLESQLLAQALSLTNSGARSQVQSQAQSQSETQSQAQSQTQSQAQPQAELQAPTQEQAQSSEQFQQIEEARVQIENELTELGEAQNLIMEQLKYQTGGEEQLSDQSALPQAIAIGPRTCNRCQETHNFSQKDIQIDSKLQTVSKPTDRLQ